MSKGLVERLKDGDSIVIAEGYLWELERRGFVKFGEYLPTVVLDRPSAVRNLHEEFALAGSDVIEAYTYYAHREQMKLFGREGDLEKLNRNALRMAREVADKYGKLMAGSLSNTPLYEVGDSSAHAKIMEIFKEQVVWAVEGGVDFIIAETFNTYGEASLALDAIKQYGKGVPAVITLAPYFPDQTTDDVSFPEACRRLEEQGAAVVGLNCSRGPLTMMPLLREVRKACKGPIAALPVPYRTTCAEKTFFASTDPADGSHVYPDKLDCVRCHRAEIRQFAEEAKQLGIQYIGLCCGNSPSLMREVAQVYGRNPPAAENIYDPSSSFIFGDNAKKYGPEMQKLKTYMLGK